MICQDEVDSLLRRPLWHVAGDTVGRGGALPLRPDAIARLRCVTGRTLAVVMISVKVPAWLVRVVAECASQLSATRGVTTTLQHPSTVASDAQCGLFAHINKKVVTMVF